MKYNSDQEDDFTIEDLRRADMMLSALSHLDDDEQTSLRMMQLRMFIYLDRLMLAPDAPPPTERELLLWNAYLDLVGNVEHYVTFGLPFRSGDTKGIEYLKSLGIHSEVKMPDWPSRAPGEVHPVSGFPHRTTATGVSLYVVDKETE